MRTQIYLNCHGLSAEQLQGLLTAELASEPGISFEVKRFRSPETAVLVAIVGAVGTGLGALIGGMLKVAAQKKVGKVTIEGRSGRKIEVPADTPPSSLEEYVRVAKELDVDRLEL